jgi:hypothetical protein
MPLHFRFSMVFCVFCRYFVFIILKSCDLNSAAKSFHYLGRVTLPILSSTGLVNHWHQCQTWHQERFWLAPLVTGFAYKSTSESFVVLSSTKHNYLKGSASILRTNGEGQMIQTKSLVGETCSIITSAIRRKG